MNVFEFARRVEHLGEERFRQLAGRSDNPGVRRMLERMAADERDLAERVATMETGLSPGQARDSAILDYLDGEVMALAERLAERQPEDDVAAFDAAAAFEEGVCRLYRKAAGQEGDAEVGDLLRQVGNLECHEARELRKAHDFINAPNEYLAWGEFSNLGEFHNFGRDVD